MKKYKKNKTDNKFKAIKYLETIVLTILILSFCVLIYCIYLSTTGGNTIWNTNDSYNAKTMSADINSESNNNIKNGNISDIIEKVNNSVVGISKIKNKGNTIFSENGTETLGIGTGFIVSENGYIVTNQHVSGDRLSTCYVTLEDGRTYNGNVVWADSDIDISIVKIDADKLAYVQLGDSDNIKIAEQVYAIGNPVGFQFQRTVTSGIISALDRTVKITENNKDYYMEDLIQTDATINPGNSGGPLINLNGEVIGIDSIKITSAEGMGFASPINLIKPILDSLEKTGNYDQATIGIFAYDKDVIPYINQDLGLNEVLSNGIYVSEVVKNSPASVAGIKEGDILLQIDNQPLNKMSELRQYIYAKKPGDAVTLKYMRNNKEAEVNIKLVKKSTI